MNAFEPRPPSLLGPDSLALHNTILHSRSAIATKVAMVGPDGSLRGPLAPLLLTPGMGDVVQRLGLSLRADSVLAADVRAIATLTVANALDCPFEWDAHSRLALEANLVTAVDIQRIADGQGPEPEAYSVAWSFASAQCAGRAAGPEVHHVAERLFMARAIVELTILVGYYQLIAMLMHNCAPSGQRQTD